MNWSTISISKVKLNPDNPRVIKDDAFKKLVKSILEFPEMLQIRPIVVDENLMVLGGNMRFKACIEAGLKEVPIVQASDLTDKQKQEFIVKDNSSYGEWDWVKLIDQVPSELLSDAGIEVPQFQLNKLIDPTDDDFEVPEIKKVETNIKVGDLYQIGDHRLYCGDATKSESYEILMDGLSASLVVTDPPYNVNYEGATSDKLKIMNDKMDDSSFYLFLFDFYSACASYVLPGSSWYVWHADTEGANFRMAFKNSGLLLKQCLVWVKNQFVMGRQDYHWKHEPCIYGWSPGAPHRWFSDRKQSTVLEFSKPFRNEDHPTMKPVPLIAYQIQNSSLEGELVLDPFAGSGTTLISCEQTKRKSRVMELDPKYCQVIIDRAKSWNPDIIIKKLN
jgi:DNA modification methylase